MNNLKNKPTTPLKAVRAMCVVCKGFKVHAISKCADEDCPLHPFRFGKSPYAKRDLSDETRQNLVKRAEHARKARAARLKEAKEGMS
jgi:hypothetical protein